MTVKKNNNLRNAIIKALGGFTEQRYAPPDLPPSILPSVKSFKFTRAKTVIIIDNAQADPRGSISDLRMQALLRQQLAEQLDRDGFINYDKKTDSRGTVLEASIYVGTDKDRESEKEE